MYGCYDDEAEWRQALEEFGGYECRTQPTHATKADPHAGITMRELVASGTPRWWRVELRDESLRENPVRARVYASSAVRAREVALSQAPAGFSVVRCEVVQ